MSQFGLVYDFWSDPIKNLKALFADTGNTTLLPDSVIGTSNSIVDNQISAYGVDPSTGALIAPQYAPSARSAGYNPAKPMDFIDQVTKKVQDQYAIDYKSSHDAQNLFPDALPDVNGLSDWLVVGLVLVLAYFLIVAVK